MTTTRRTLVALFGLMLGFGSAMPATAESRAQSSSSPAVTLVAPAGWFTSANGTVVAETEADLTADAVPSGPRAQLVVVRTGKSGKSAKKADRALTKRITAAESSDPELVDGPTDVTLGSGGLTGTVITFSVTTGGTGLVRRYVIVNEPGAQPALVLLEAPEAQWSAAVDTLMSTLNG